MKKNHLKIILSGIGALTLIAGSVYLNSPSIKRGASRSPASLSDQPVTENSTAATLYNTLTQHGNNARTGVNLYEKTLTTTNVNPTQFGMLFKIPTDAFVYAQPLYVANVNFGKKIGVHNIVLIATMGNTIYVADADTGAVIWTKNIGKPAKNTDFGPEYLDIIGSIGILSTPVIDLTTNTIYVVAETKSTQAHVTTFYHHLHAIDLITHEEKENGPVAIDASVPGTAPEAVSGVVTLDHSMQLQRPALLLDHERIYIAFASHADYLPFHGWVLAYDATSLKQLGVYNTSPNNGGAGVWQSGQGLAADAAGNVYGVSGNGFNSDPTQLSDRPGSVLKFSFGASGFGLSDYYTPSDWEQLDEDDLDLGVGGVVVLQDKGLIVAGSKTGTVYNLLMNNLGKLTTNDTGLHQSFPAANGHIHGTPIYWDGPNGPMIYLWSENDYLKVFALHGRLFDKTPVMQSTMEDVQESMPGAFLTISSNENASGSSILWSNMVNAGNANQATVPGILRAFDATDVTKELWTSLMVPSRDDLGEFGKFSPPTVANGKVYQATFSNQVVVYGLLP